MTLQEIKLKQIEILDEIHFLYKGNEHNSTGKVCDCSICREMRSLGRKYEDLTIKQRSLRNTKQVGDPRVAEIMTRRHEMTKADLEYLLIDNMLSQREAAEMLRVSRSYIARHCKDYGLTYNAVKAERRRRHGYIE